jgi:predicted DNA binding CopG/RHH family protein
MKEIPKFKSEEEEQQFWAEHDSTEFVDWSNAQRAVFPNLKPSTKTISLRLPESMLEELKLLANRNDIPYQTLVKVFLSDRNQRILACHRSTPFDKTDDTHRARFNAQNESLVANPFTARSSLGRKVV